MNFYKSVIEHHGKLLVRGIHEGKEFTNLLSMLNHKKKVNLNHLQVKI
jgi:hypothetical protein